LPRISLLGSSVNRTNRCSEEIASRDVLASGTGCDDDFIHPSTPWTGAPSPLGANLARLRRRRTGTKATSGKEAYHRSHVLSRDPAKKAEADKKKAGDLRDPGPIVLLVVVEP
jgi:hypothetical protein